jgi:hypothetical protein
MQGRFVDADMKRENETLKNNLMLCEVVFLFDAPLIEANTVTFGLGPDDKPAVTMERSTVANRFRAEVGIVRGFVSNALAAVHLACFW